VSRRTPPSIDSASTAGGRNLTVSSLRDVALLKIALCFPLGLQDEKINKNKKNNQLLDLIKIPIVRKQ
jgi:hypothetical protein